MTYQFSDISDRCFPIIRSRELANYECVFLAATAKRKCMLLVVNTDLIVHARFSILHNLSNLYPRGRSHRTENYSVQTSRHSNPYFLGGKETSVCYAERGKDSWIPCLSRSVVRHTFNCRIPGSPFSPGSHRWGPTRHGVVETDDGLHSLIPFDNNIIRDLRWCNTPL